MLSINIVATLFLTLRVFHPEQVKEWLGFMVEYLSSLYHLKKIWYQTVEIDEDG